MPTMTNRDRAPWRIAVIGLAATTIVGVAAWWRCSERSSVEPPRVTGRRWERVVVLEKFDGSAWKPVYEVKKTGTGADGMAWPSDVPPADVPATTGALRAGARVEFLYLELGPLGTCRVAADIWSEYADGAAVSEAVRGDGGTLACSAL